MVAFLALGGCVLVALLVLGKAWRRRRSIYQYGVRDHQCYEFPDAVASLPVGRLNDGLFELPPCLKSFDVALLELEIRASPLGYWFEPSIQVQAGACQYRQPFERGGVGRRFVDVSELALAGQNSIRLSGRHLRIGDQSVVVHYLRHGIDLERHRILVLAPHPDDAEIAAFGLYADRNSHIVTVTAGEAGEPGPFGMFNGARAYREKGRNRTWNSLTVPMLGGVPIEQTANLGYFDGTLEAMGLRPGNPVRSTCADADSLEVFGRSQFQDLFPDRRGRVATWNNLVEDLEHVIQAAQPDVLVAPYPLLDAHPDHKMSTRALIQALKNLKRQNGSLLLYTNHLPCSDRYPFGQAGDLMSLPPSLGHIYFDGIVSVPLGRDKQARKHMALDAMIDLRQDLRIRSLRQLAVFGIGFLKNLATDGNGDDYFRRAVRANELFFEVRVSSLYESGVTERIVGDMPVRQPESPVI